MLPRRQRAPARTAKPRPNILRARRGFTSQAPKQSLASFDKENDQFLPAVEAAIKKHFGTIVINRKIMSH